MCEREASTVEHVPPLCIFPESKDLPHGLDLRRNLITVPSCMDHNTRTSRDDEYLLYTLVVNLPANETAFQQFSTKVTRAMERNPSLMRLLMTKLKPVVVEDKTTGERFESASFEVDTARFYGALEKVARGLHFHHFGARWIGPVEVYPEFLLSLDESQSLKTNEATRKIAQASDALFRNSAAYGQNPQVFHYQVHRDDARRVTLMRLSFYGRCRVTVAFEP